MGDGMGTIIPILDHLFLLLSIDCRFTKGVYEIYFKIFCEICVSIIKIHTPL